MRKFIIVVYIVISIFFISSDMLVQKEVSTNHFAQSDELFDQIIYITKDRNHSKEEQYKLINYFNTYNITLVKTTMVDSKLVKTALINDSEYQSYLHLSKPHALKDDYFYSDDCSRKEKCSQLAYSGTKAEIRPLFYKNTDLSGYYQFDKGRANEKK